MPSVSLDLTDVQLEVPVRVRGEADQSIYILVSRLHRFVLMADDPYAALLHAGKLITRKPQD